MGEVIKAIPMVVRLHHPFATMFGAVVASIVIMFWTPIGHIGSDLYDKAFPIVVQWKVIKAENDNGDLVISGTLIKKRDCVFLPPTLARDDQGRNYPVISTSPTAGKTWAASPNPQQFGPWRVVGAAGKRLTFINVYLCDGSDPSVVELGVFG